MKQLSFLPDGIDLEETIRNLEGLYHPDRDKLYEMIKATAQGAKEELFIRFLFGIDQSVDGNEHYFLYENDLDSWIISFAITPENKVVDVKQFRPDTRGRKI